MHVRGARAGCRRLRATQGLMCSLDGEGVLRVLLVSSGTYFHARFGKRTHHERWWFLQGEPENDNTLRAKVH